MTDYPNESRILPYETVTHIIYTLNRTLYSRRVYLHRNDFYCVVGFEQKIIGEFFYIAKLLERNPRYPSVFGIARYLIRILLLYCEKLLSILKQQPSAWVLILMTKWELITYFESTCLIVSYNTLSTMYNIRQFSLYKILFIRLLCANIEDKKKQQRKEPFYFKM